MTAIYVVDLEFLSVVAPGLRGGHGTMRFRYDRREPWAVHMLLLTHEGDDIYEWRVDRSVLADGLEYCAGDGHVYVQHVKEGVEIHLRDEHDGESVLRFDRDKLLGFLAATCRVVTPGTETIDFDAELDELLGRAS